MSNFRTKMANLKALFALPKWLKVFLIVLSAIFAVGIIGACALNIATSGKIYNAKMSLHEQKTALERNEIKGEFSYTAQIQFQSLASLLRSQSISNVVAQGYKWDSAVDTSAFKGLKHSKRNVFFNSTQDLGALGLESLGVVEYKVDFYPLMRSLVKYFVNILVFVMVFFALWRVFVNLLHSLPPKRLEYMQKIALTRKDYAFLGFAFALCAGICSFSFWLGFPGFHHFGDMLSLIMLDKSGWHPVFYIYIFQLFLSLFGEHIYYFFLFNLIPFYLGIWFLIAGFYLRFKNPFALILIFPTFIGNIYFQNFIPLSNFNLAMLLFCLYSLLLFIVLVPLDSSKKQKIISKILWILLFVLMFFAILWRHNAIFSVFPAFFVLCYIFLKDRRLAPKLFTKYYVLLIGLSAIGSLSVVIGVPKILQTHKGYPANHLFLHQIAGTCVPANDSSCFNSEWYLPNKNFDNVKKTYSKFPFNADALIFGDTIYDDYRTFRGGKLSKLQTQWAKSILKYPLNYIKYQSKWFENIWFQNPGWIFDAKQMQSTRFVTHFEMFPNKERSIKFSYLREQIYNFCYNHKILLNCAWGVGVGFVILMLSSAILWRRRKVVFADSLCQNNTLLIFAFSVSFATFWSAFFIAAFSPVTDSRYMSPILPMAIVALIGLVAFVMDYLARKKNANLNAWFLYAKFDV
ncbi:hypothetical protein [Helicobacter sp. T3_23-1056]